jgi:hypothetical protein
LSDGFVALHLSRNQAAFLQVSLYRLAITTRQAMAQPGLDPERHKALVHRAVVLEITDDAVRGAMLEVPNSTRKSARGVKTLACSRLGQALPAARHGRERPRPVLMRTRSDAEPANTEVVSKDSPESAPPVLHLTPASTAASVRSASLVDGARRDRIQRTRSNAWLNAFVGGRREAS